METWGFFMFDIYILWIKKTKVAISPIHFLIS